MMENANRECSLGNKEYFYDMMIRLNEKCFNKFKILCLTKVVKKCFPLAIAR